MNIVHIVFKQQHKPFYFMGQLVILICLYEMKSLALKGFFILEKNQFVFLAACFQTAFIQPHFERISF